MEQWSEQEKEWKKNQNVQFKWRTDFGASASQTQWATDEKVLIRTACIKSEWNLLYYTHTQSILPSPPEIRIVCPSSASLLFAFI